MEGSKACVIDGLLSRTMIGTRGEAMMLNNSSRLPSRRPCCRPFALLLVGREGEVRERSELVHQMEASVNHRAAKSPTRLRHCASTSASRVIIAPGHPPNLIEYFSAISGCQRVESRHSIGKIQLRLLAPRWSLSLYMFKFCGEHPDRGSEASEDSRNVSVTPPPPVPKTGPSHFAH